MLLKKPGRTTNGLKQITGELVKNLEKVSVPSSWVIGGFNKADGYQAETNSALDRAFCRVWGKYFFFVKK